MNKSHLYLLHFPQINAIKIGKANDLQKRIEVLTRHWGEVDYAGSYFLKTKESDVLKLEKSLHFLMGHFKLEFDNGDGKEEMFKLEALDHIKQHLNLYITSSGQPMDLVKGVTPKIIKKAVVKQKKTIGFASFIKKDKRALDMFNDSRLKIIKLHKVVHFLLTHHERIKYQYVYEEYNSFKIAFIKDALLTRVDEKVLWNLFRHQASTQTGFSFKFYGSKMKTTQFSPTIIQIEFLFETFDDEDYILSPGRHILDLIHTIRKLPERSALLESDIVC